MKKKIIWIIQSNQITPTIYDFLKTLHTRMEKLLDLSFMVPDSSSEIMGKIKDLKPVIFKTFNRTAVSSYQTYLAKQDNLNNSDLNKTGFTEGLEFADILLLDDLGGGAIRQTIIEIENNNNTCGLIIQIPTPLGSSDIEEQTFHASILWARDNNIPIIGYELLPLDTRWTLAPSLLDGVITRYNESYDYLIKTLNHKNIWLLPLYEASIFSSVATNFNTNGTKSSYHYKSTCSIPGHRTVLYIPHNVAMIYEYREMLKIIAPVADQLHLMFSIGKDQVRGAYTQKEVIETVYHDELKKLASFSFHNMNNPWEMLMADSLVACSACFQTMIAQEKNIPTIIFDPLLPPMETGFKKRVAQKKNLLDAVKKTIELKAKKSELGDILMLLTKIKENQSKSNKSKESENQSGENR